MILYDDAYAFLVGYPDPPPGWVKIPGNETQGGSWRWFRTINLKAKYITGSGFLIQTLHREPLLN